MTTPKRLIFLDIDGVLLPHAYIKKVRRDCFFEVDPATIPHMNTILAESGADIVISSSIRIGYSLESIEKMLRDAGLIGGRFVGETPCPVCDPPQHPRAHEIQSWLDKNDPQGEAEYLIIDDCRFEGPLRRHLLWVDGETGLSAAHVKRARRFFDGYRRGGKS
jgi:hypothetical protein